MPLLDHFHPPLSERRHWDAFHARWASAITDALNEHGLPAHLFAEPTVNIGGQVQVDVAALNDSGANGNGTRAVATITQKAAAPSWVIPAVFPDSFAVHVIKSEGGPRLVATIELVSPGNKDRPQTRRAFAVKCANYLYQGISCMVMDVVTNRTANLHNEIMDLMQAADFRLPAEVTLYAVAYHPVRRQSGEEIDAWKASFAIGEPLPSLPLYLDSEFSVLIDFEASYQETCRRLRLVASRSN